MPSAVLENNWVVDLDIESFFDSLDHDLVVRTVQANTSQKWVLLYVKRWAKAPLQMPDGTLRDRDRGTPQGSAVLPCTGEPVPALRNGFRGRNASSRRWNSSGMRMTWCCIVQLSIRQARCAMLSRERLESLGLRLHPGKTRTVIARTTTGAASLITRRSRSCAMSSVCAVRRTGIGRCPPRSAGDQPDALKAKSQEVRGWRIHKRIGSGLAELAEWINPVVCGGMNDDGQSGRSRSDRLLQRINMDIVRWARNKYRRLGSFKKAKRWWTGLVDREPWPVCPLGPGYPRSERSDEKSRVTGDC